MCRLRAFSFCREVVELAATRLIALHKNKGKSVAACLKSRTDYAQNPDKTEQGQLVSSYKCSPLTVDEEFMLTKRQYDLVNGRRQKSDVIAYQIRQSFRPGEITAEEANKVGYELAMRFTKGKHAFVVATHTDRQHIHNHVIFNSTALDGSRKFRDFFFSALAVQRLSDLICLEHQLSVIEKKPYRERQSVFSILQRRATVTACAESSTPSLRKSRRTLKFFCKSWSSRDMRRSVASTRR